MADELAGQVAQLQSDPFEIRQLSFWQSEIDVFSDEARRWKHIAMLEREAESARFDWADAMDMPNASALWCIFAYRAGRLKEALEAFLQNRRRLLLRGE